MENNNKSEETMEVSEEQTESSSTSPLEENGVEGLELPAGLTEEDIKNMSPEELEEKVRELEEKQNKSSTNEWADPREFEYDFLHTYMNEPFLGAVSLGITKRPDWKCDTAYVGVNPKTEELVLGYNPKFFRSLTPEHRRGVIRHELYHVIFSHITERMPAEKELAVAWNLATDMAINSIIKAENLPDIVIIPGKEIPPRKDMSNLDKSFNEFVKNAPQLEASEFYFEQIKKLIDEDRKNGGDGNVSVYSVDDHSMWGKLPENIRDFLKEKVKNMIGSAARNADQKNQWGSVPAEIQERIRKMLSKEIDWRSVVRNFFGRVRSMERNCTIKRINKKMPYIYPGVKRNTVANFACFIDQSGSVSDEDICLFFGELESFAEETQLDVYHFDTEVDESSHTVWKKGTKIQPSRTRCGGTDFDCVQRFCNDRGNKGKWSGIVILTDGYAPKMGHIVGSKVLWVITQNGDISAARPGDYVIQLKKDKKMKAA